MRPGLNGTVTEMPAFFAAFSTPAQPARTIKSAREIFLPPDCEAVEVTLNLFECLQHLLKLLGLIDLPILLWSKADARAVCAAALVGSTVGGRRRPGGRDELRDRQPRGENLLFQRGDILVIDQRMIHCGDGILPEQFFLRNFRAEVARARSHVAMSELEPRAGEGIRKRSRILVEAPRDLFVDRDRIAERDRWSASPARDALRGRERPVP